MPTIATSSISATIRCAGRALGNRGRRRTRSGGGSLRRQPIVPLDYPEPVAADWPELLGIVEAKVKPSALAVVAKKQVEPRPTGRRLVAALSPSQRPASCHYRFATKSGAGDLRGRSARRVRVSAGGRGLREYDDRLPRCRHTPPSVPSNPVLTKYGRASSAPP